ncbi:hypothetical protein ACIGCZ_38645 [Streptomyces nigra]|uniref:hypothetical protein n=1 Tax=Streptomyces nigra TaxID=1827580 RepID=UPI0037D26505
MGSITRTGAIGSWKAAWMADRRTGRNAESAAACDLAEATADIQLYDSYEEADEALATGKLGRFVVANAYTGISVFYMDPALDLAGAFVFDTPHYGIAQACRHQASHPPGAGGASHGAAADAIHREGAARQAPGRQTGTG